MHRSILQHDVDVAKNFSKNFEKTLREEKFSQLRFIRMVDSATTSAINGKAIELLRLLIGNDNNEDERHSRKFILSRSAYQLAQTVIEEESNERVPVVVKGTMMILLCPLLYIFHIVTHSLLSLENLASADMEKLIAAVISSNPEYENRGVSQEDWDKGVRPQVPTIFGKPRILPSKLSPTTLNPYLTFCFDFCLNKAPRKMGQSALIEKVLYLRA